MQEELMESLQKECKEVETEIERNREALKSVGSGSSGDLPAVFTRKLTEELGNIDKSIKEKESYKALQKDEFELKSKILRKLDSDLEEARQDHQDCLSQVEELSLALSIQKVSIRKREETLAALAELKRDVAAAVS